MKVEKTNESKKEDTERLEYLLRSGNQVVYLDQPGGKGYRVLMPPITYLTSYHDTPRKAIDAALLTLNAQLARRKP